jgi:hypothetical protein
MDSEARKNAPGRGRRAWRTFLKVTRDGSFLEWYAKRREEEAVKRTNLEAGRRAMAIERASFEARRRTRSGDLSVGFEALAPYAYGLAMGGFLVGFGIGVFQWLKTGHWPVYDGWLVMRHLGSNAWLDAPTSWIGLHRLVTLILDAPLILTVPLLFLGIGWVFQANGEAHCEHTAPDDTE